MTEGVLKANSSSAGIGDYVLTNRKVTVSGLTLLNTGQVLDRVKYPILATFFDVQSGILPNSEKTVDISSVVSQHEKVVMVRDLDGIGYLVTSSSTSSKYATMVWKLNFNTGLATLVNGSGVANSQVESITVSPNGKYIGMLYGVTPGVDANYIKYSEDFGATWHTYHISTKERSNHTIKVNDSGEWFVVIGGGDNSPYDFHFLVGKNKVWTSKARLSTSQPSHNFFAISLDQSLVAVWSHDKFRISVDKATTWLDRFAQLPATANGPMLRVNDDGSALIVESTDMTNTLYVYFISYDNALTWTRHEVALVNPLNSQNWTIQMLADNTSMRFRIHANNVNDSTKIDSVNFTLNYKTQTITDYGHAIAEADVFRLIDSNWYVQPSNGKDGVIYGLTHSPKLKVMKLISGNYSVIPDYAKTSGLPLKIVADKV